MKKRVSPKKVGSKGKTKWVIGRNFEKISEVEGIVFTAEMRTRADKFARNRVSFDERRRAIVKAYRKA
jgi:hypothetical protein